MTIFSDFNLPWEVGLLRLIPVFFLFCFGDQGLSLMMFFLTSIIESVYARVYFSDVCFLYESDLCFGGKGL